MFLLQLAVVLLLAIGAVVMLVLAAQRQSTREAGNRSLAVAQGFASSPGLVEALQSRDPTTVLQPRVEEAGKGSGVDFVGVLNRAGNYYAASVPGRIGLHTTTDMAPLLAGRTVREEGVGSLGPQTRAYVPVKQPDGSVVGAVAAAITIEHVGNRVAEQLPAVLGATAGAVAVTTGGAALLSRRLLRQTHGLGPAAITRMYEHHDAVLHSVKEGVLILDEDGRLLLANDEAQRLLDLPPEAESRHVDELGLPPLTAELLASGREATDEVHRAGGRLLAVNQRPTDRYGGPPGSVAMLRDSTELRALSGKVKAARQRLKVLYDASVSIGTTLEVTRTAEELAEAAVPEFADFVTVDLAESVLHGEEPKGTEQKLRRTATTGIREDHPLYPTGELISFVSSSPQVKGLAIGRAVLEPDLRTATGWRAQDPERARRILEYGIHSLITVPLSARGVVLGVASFLRSAEPEPFEEDDVALAEELAARAAVCIDNARRYTREHTTAVTLQRSLLPRGLPDQGALEVAYRYLPAHAVGGDWFDVIPLPGARVALVVGDVVGHGVHAAATMGRLRTAVHNFSALDLPPDELLAHLDELVARTDTDETAEEDSAGITGATCLYAIYDPVTGNCALGRAGHPPPAVVHPDGTMQFPDVPVSPPLGVASGLPFETAELHLPEGSRLILYTDGLIEHRHRDLDAGLDLLRTTLTGRPHLTSEETCQTVFDTMLPERPSDDIALLVARTRLLDPAQVAEWDVPSDPAAVAPIRTQCARRLQEWGLEEIAFTTELILSELITNAIRYGTQPIRVRLLHDRTLICEVSDGSSTSPHLRRAATTDEGGRGLFLVAQYAQRWGTRYFPRGKVIWSEQALHDGATEPSADLADALLDQWDE
ncbi:SpoIIE family protein phosphatase [Streptomyces sp. Je 1-4]|uniref:SpoIIE family protein phosphatase n=1 Tax=Streptomyces TaxID=1883 RepID=UPI002180BF4F|nr:MULTISPECIES: SpoIIE family protein phosphatase [unclassified Streptomyces]UYB39076.1 SpoIIE family protein phosphatase [Streptomyces sp. Je 1-4]UZQ35078.1 SpoIIE family protein phosphatase [Streptomyces sp. Je 1-4] [Streptomyces sp. Je 1-4 4N24]UZQ42496.1 SpoIIE family protein phosphatase [Streptomyces sp. Je 1-4] [Streptomyces sp. Je 1-4 4N24_ara]